MQVSVHLSLVISRLRAWLKQCASFSILRRVYVYLAAAIKRALALFCVSRTTRGKRPGSWDATADEKLGALPAKPPVQTVLGLSDAGDISPSLIESGLHQVNGHRDVREQAVSASESLQEDQMTPALTDEQSKSIKVVPIFPRESFRYEKLNAT